MIYKNRSAGLEIQPDNLGQLQVDSAGLFTTSNTHTKSFDVRLISCVIA